MIKPLIICGILSVAFIGCSKDKDDPKPPATGGGGNGGGGVYAGSVMEKIDNTEGLDSFSVAAAYIGLDDKLVKEGNLTVFAPSNQAFELFLDARGASHISALSPEILAHELNYHVGTTQLKKANFAGVQYMKTFDENGPNGNSVMIQLVTKNGDTKVSNQYALNEPEISGNNGVIHIVNRIFTKPTVSDFINNDERLANLNTLFKKDPPSYFKEFNSGDGGRLVTFFGPTNEAFDDFINKNPLYNSLNDIDYAHIPSVLNIQAVGGSTTPLNLRTEDIEDNQVIQTWEITNGKLTFKVSENDVITIKTPNPSQQEINFVEENLQASNGVLHIIDAVVTNQ